MCEYESTVRTYPLWETEAPLARPLPGATLLVGGFYVLALLAARRGHRSNHHHLLNYLCDLLGLLVGGWSGWLCWSNASRAFRSFTLAAISTISIDPHREMQASRVPWNAPFARLGSTIRIEEITMANNTPDTTPLTPSNVRGIAGCKGGIPGRRGHPTLSAKALVAGHPAAKKH